MVVGYHLLWATLLEANKLGLVERRGLSKRLPVAIAGLTPLMLIRHQTTNDHQWSLPEKLSDEPAQFGQALASTDDRRDQR
jgi:hypothetical protein